MLLLLENGANIDEANDLCMTPLHYAAVYGYDQMAQVLIQNGAAINAEDDS